MDHIDALYADPRSHKRCLSVVFAPYSRIVQLSCDACITVCKQGMQVSLGLLEIWSVCLVKYESRQAVFVFGSVIVVLAICVLMGYSVSEVSSLVFSLHTSYGQEQSNVD